jgi:lysine/ornithine N-monooxygenase
MVTKEKKEKKYHSHMTAKLHDRAKNWSWTGWATYGVCSILTVGILPAADITHSVVCDQFGIAYKNYEDYYEWVTTTYEEEEIYCEEVDKITIDEEKKKKHDEAKEEQYTAEAYLLKIESDLKAADHDYDTCLYLLWYLSEKLEKNKLGNSVGIEQIIAKLEIELEIELKRMRKNARIGLESKIQKLRRENEILRMARSRKVDNSDKAKYADAIFNLEAEILEEQANEGKKLSNRRKFCSILKPSLINKNGCYQEMIKNIKTKLNQRLIRSNGE